MASVSNRSESSALPGSERPSPQSHRGAPLRVEANERTERLAPLPAVPAPTGSIAAIELSLGF